MLLNRSQQVRLAPWLCWRYCANTVSPGGHGPACAHPAPQRAWWRAAARSHPWYAGWSHKRWSFLPNSDGPPATAGKHVTRVCSRVHSPYLCLRVSPRWKRPSSASDWRVLLPHPTRPAANRSLHWLLHPCRGKPGVNTQQRLINEHRFLQDRLSSPANASTVVQGNPCGAPEGVADKVMDCHVCEKATFRCDVDVLILLLRYWFSREKCMLGNKHPKAQSAS